MYSLAKDLLFLHGYLTRPEDLEPSGSRTDMATPSRDAAEPARETRTLHPADCGA